MRAVTAAIIKKDGKILICQRPEGKKLAGMWEFPGGKMEHGETPEEGLVRELREELGFEARVGKIIDAQAEYGVGEFIILYYEVEIASGEPAALEHAQIKYVLPEELNSYEFPRTDSAVVKKLVNG